MKSVRIQDVKSGERNLDDLDDLRFFRDTFQSLLSVICLQDQKLRRNTRFLDQTRESESESEVVGRKRGASSLSYPHPKRNRPERVPHAFPQRLKTPDQPLLPATATLSGASGESCDEEDTKALLNHFCNAVLSIVKSEVRCLHWLGNDNRAEITKTYFLSELFLISVTKMRVAFGWGKGNM